MGSKNFRPVVFIFLLFFLDNVQGFKRLTSRSWAINESDPTIWVKLSYEDLTKGLTDTSFRDGSAPLTGVASDEQITEVIRMVFNDYNSVEGSYLRFAFYPVSGIDFGTDAADSPFDEGVANIRTITIGNGGARTVESGHAIPEFDANRFIGCDINIVGDNFRKAEVLKKILTHELGHCLGMNHNHADKSSIMSYLAPADQHSLGIDDKIAVINLYPKSTSLDDSQNTMGLGCSTKK